MKYMLNGFGRFRPKPLFSIQEIINEVLNMNTTKHIIEKSNYSGSVNKKYFELELLPGKFKGLKDYRLNICTEYPNGTVDKGNINVSAEELRNLSDLLNRYSYMFEMDEIDSFNDYSELYNK